MHTHLGPRLEMSTNLFKNPLWPYFQGSPLFPFLRPHGCVTACSLSGISRSYVDGREVIYAYPFMNQPRDEHMIPPETSSGVCV